MQYTSHQSSRSKTSLRAFRRPLASTQQPQVGAAEPNQLSSMKVVISALTLSLFFIAALLFSPTKALATSDCTATPSPELTPQQVVKTVIEALRDNDLANTGIATVFCFASPQNRLQTGPLKRFTQMIKSGFSDMLNHSDSYFEPMEIEGNQAVQPVWLTSSNGVEQGYLFSVALQQTGPFAGMWMTEAVMPIKRNGGRSKGERTI